MTRVTESNGSVPTVQCFRCGRPAQWLVTHSYDGSRGIGRLMAYCDDCRADAQAILWLAMPLDVLWLNPSKVMQLLYEQDHTATDPQVLSEMLNLPGPWVRRVQPFVDNYERRTQ